MKKIEAIIKPFLLDDLHEALLKRGFVAMTVSEVRRFQQLLGTPMVYQERVIPIEVGFSMRLKVEIVLTDADIDAAVEIIQTSAQIEVDGLVVQDVDDVIRIRTNEHGAIAV